ncbi:MAG: hypothetical protein AB7I19_10360 [Planctomycetota bacterium]
MSRALAALFLVTSVPLALAQESQSRAQERSIDRLERSRYFLIPPRAVETVSESRQLLVVLPGGDGSAEFLPFVENGIAHQVSDDCVVAMLTATKWTDDQNTIWASDHSPVKGMGYTTEAFVNAVVETLSKEFSVQPAAVAVLAWSSSGPTIYSMLVDSKAPFTKGYVAMSVWPKHLRKGKLDGARGRRLVLDQSPQDTRTPFHHVRAAHAALAKARATVRVNVYEGGHGWVDMPLPRLRDSIAWLFDDAAAPPVKWPPPPKVGKNLLANPGFEATGAADGIPGWTTNDNSKRVVVEVVEIKGPEGKRALHLRKSGAAPLDLVAQDVELPTGKKLEVSLRIKSGVAASAIVKVWRYDENDEPIGNDVDLIRIPANIDWKQFEKTWPTEGAVRATIQIIVISDSEIWVDDASIVVKK